MAPRTQCDHVFDSKNFIFSVLTIREKESLRKNHKCLNFAKGETIFTEGDRPTGLLCLAEGNVKVFKEGVGGRNLIIKLLKPIKLVGYRALFADEPYMSSAEALEDCCLALIERDMLHKLMKSNHELSIRILKIMAEELGISNNKAVALTQKHIRGRLAEAILNLVDIFGFEKDKETIKVYLPREDIAGLSNMTTSNAIRTLSNFATEQIIDLKGRKIVVKDYERLIRICELG